MSQGQTSSMLSRWCYQCICIQHIQSIQQTTSSRNTHPGTLDQLFTNTTTNGTAALPDATEVIIFTTGDAEGAIVSPLGVEEEEGSSDGGCSTTTRYEYHDTSLSLSLSVCVCVIYTPPPAHTLCIPHVLPYPPPCTQVWVRCWYPRHQHHPDWWLCLYIHTHCLPTHWFTRHPTHRGQHQWGL